MARVKTEKAWLNSATPHSLLGALKGKRSPRQRRLLAVACCRRWLDEMPAPESRHAVEVAERYADGAAERDELDAAYRAAQGALYNRSGPLVGAWNLAYAAQIACAPSGFKRVCAALLRRARQLGGDREGQEKRAQCDLIRDAFGNPFRPPPSVDPSWLAWKDGTIPKLAQSIYDERAFDRLPILADALEEAGCTDPDVLDHCRRPGEHARGCWVVDSVLGKG